MLPLPELQAQLAAAILEKDATRVAGTIAADGLSPAARVQVYWHHVFTSLTEALATTYPVVCRLVDRRFFGFAADCYIRRHPPTGPCLVEYGATFPDFLASFPPCAGHPYLADVARLEWALNLASHADDVPAMEPTALGAVPAEDAGRIVFGADPSASWLHSPWPIDRIWQANQPDADPATTVDLASGPARLEIRRRDDVATLGSLAPATFAFRAALGAGATLETAADAATTEDPDFDLSGALRAALADGLLTGFTVEAGEGSPRG